MSFFYTSASGSATDTNGLASLLITTVIWMAIENHFHVRGLGSKLGLNCREALNGSEYFACSKLHTGKWYGKPAATNAMDVLDFSISRGTYSRLISVEAGIDFLVINQVHTVVFP